MKWFLIGLAIYAAGFLYVLLRCLFENDNKLGNGPNWSKACFGAIFGLLWFPLMISAAYQWLFKVGAYQDMDKK